MEINRRDFVKLIGGSLFGLAVGSTTGAIMKLPKRAEPILYNGPRKESWKLTACTKCPGGCSLRIRLIDGLPIQAFGNPLSPVNKGGICPLGLVSVADLYHPSRLTGPMRKVDGEFKPVSYNEAYKILSDNLRKIITDKKQNDVFIAAQTESRIRKSLFEKFSAVTGFRNLVVDNFHAAGNLPFLNAAAEAPDFIDFDKCDYILNFGSQMTEISRNPLYFLRKVNDYREKGYNITAIQPRLTPNVSKLDKWIPARPEQFGTVALGIAYVLLKDGQYDKKFVERNFNGFDSFKAFVLENFIPDKVEELTGVSSDKIMEIGREFEKASSPVAYFDETVLYSSNGTQNAYAIIALNALKGFSGYGMIKGKSFSTFLQNDSKNYDGLTSADLTERLLSGRRLEALIIAGSNFVFNNPNTESLKKQLGSVPFIVSFGSFIDETSVFADLIIPDNCNLEKLDLLLDESMGTPSITLQQPVVEPFFKTVDTGDVLISLMKDLPTRQAGPDSGTKISYGNYSDYVRQFAKKIYSGKEGIFLDQSEPTVIEKGLRKIGWQTEQFGSFDDFWESLLDSGGWWNPFAEKEPYSPKIDLRQVFDEKSFLTKRVPLSTSKSKLRLNIYRRNLDYKGNMSIYPVLVEQFGNAWTVFYQLYAEINPKTAQRLSLSDRKKVIIETNKGKFLAVLVFNPIVMPGSIDVPFGLGHMVLGDTCGFNPLSFSDNIFDKISGKPSFGETFVKIDGSTFKDAPESAQIISNQNQLTESKKRKDYA